ncbi:hypothetical protein KDX38_08555 [Pseudomonas sp. CDFA 602]|uniref:hypothetical protein n=1 Tax=Pseudomonas californiensis TaxID=2829823 RepID=UPI001E4DF7F9|nr:hypothetical protein [Pseudomonas californiensis]MCD5993671.1 hypothetical protein [Pseudomonas californiensis]MCD5999266.1 hypothetical protein [Pseudomonas californiensis]
MLIPKPANAESDYVIDFCRHVVENQAPIVVTHKPLFGKPMMDCFGIIPEHVVAQGGKQLIGWAIWDTAGIFIEAEFHAIWEDAQGNLIDLTPRPIPDQTTLFLPDPRREYRGRQVDNIRRPLVDDRDVVRYLHLAGRCFSILNKGDLADQHGEIYLPPKVEREYRNIQKEMMQLQHRYTRRYE